MRREPFGKCFGLSPKLPLVASVKENCRKLLNSLRIQQRLSLTDINRKEKAFFKNLPLELVKWLTPEFSINLNKCAIFEVDVDDNVTECGKIISGDLVFFV